LIDIFSKVKTTLLLAAIFNGREGRVQRKGRKMSTKKGKEEEDEEIRLQLC